MFCTVLGLYDTVFDVDNDKERAQAQGVEPNGFSFEGADTAGVDYALNRQVTDFCSLNSLFYLYDWNMLGFQIWYERLIVEMEILDGIVNGFVIWDHVIKYENTSMVSLSFHP